MQFTKIDIEKPTEIMAIIELCYKAKLINLSSYQSLYTVLKYTGRGLGRGLRFS